MNDPTRTDDELISSYIDGEATLDDIARIEADPTLPARVQEFQAVKNLLSTPVPPLPGSDVDRLIGNALTQSTSDRVTDLTAARGVHSFNPQRLAAVAAALVLLAGVVGALIARNSDSGDDMAAVSAESTETADEYFEDDGGAKALDSDMAESDMGFSDDMDDEMFDADEMFNSGEMEMFDASDDMAEPAEPDEAPADDEASEDTAARTMSYHPLDLEIAARYETLDELISHTTEQWSELVAGGATATPQVIEEQGIAEQALAEAACGQELHDFIDALDHSVGSGGVSVGETTIAGSLTTVVVVKLSVDAAELLTTAEPDCEIAQLATLNP
ncbi:MAG: hypothetical protein OXF75_08780 [Acidimicrobiaceae bacterium]|nr:hypothetical protein [Acidimicrobiaceae bacterium]